MQRIQTTDKSNIMVSLLTLNSNSSLVGSDISGTAFPSSSKSFQVQISNNNRVWIKQSAIDEARKKEKPQQSQPSTNKPVDLQQTSNNKPVDVSTSSSHSSSTATPTARNGKKSTSSTTTSTTVPMSAGSSHSASNQSSISSICSLGDRSPFVRKGLSLSNKFSSNNATVILQAPILSSCGSSGTAQETDLSSLCTDASNQSCRQTQLWGWKAGYLLENSGGHILVQLASSDGSRSSSPASTVRLPSDALTVGDVVLSNEYQINPDTGMPMPPNDLITLTHLHEPAVIESLQQRYSADQIYTNTGPVLLALNPFQTVRGLYGEAIQKKYWERAERNQNQDLPPHVYAIADESFRCMVRALEDESSGKTANQSILVSGESGAGKTVTTKFVMKYLAALSHRSTALQESNDKRAYLKARDVNANNTAQLASSNTGSAKSSNINASKTKGVFVGGSSVSDNVVSIVKGMKTSNGHSPSINELTGGADAVGNSIEAQVLQSNPILESFGNARTVRNDNSSRFGKFIEIQFTQTGKLVGAQIETYLLEKVRLITQTAGERNYHIFYELLSGAIDRRELSQCFLAHTATPDDFKITAISGTYDRRDGVTDRETYTLLRQAMKTMNFSPEDILNVFKVTAAILHASNLVFIDTPGKHDEECELDKANIHVDPVCSLLGVSVEALNQALSTYTIQAGKSTYITRSFNKSKAATGLEALLKESYGALFTYLVRVVNGSIAYKGDSDITADVDNIEVDRKDENLQKGSHQKPGASIGVLDIFGFESFTTNSFEQLCINYCNEALQQQFNAFVLRNEQAEYEAEGIEWSFIEFPENQDVLDLIDSSVGILRVLDDQCRAPGPSDKALAANIYQQCGGSARFIASRKQQATLKFSVLHYAGPVEYTFDGFTEKNRDELPKESIELLLQSEVPFVRELAKIMSENPEATPNTSNTPLPTPAKARLHRLDSSVGRATVGGQFRRQLRTLRYKIDLTTPHYIRCLKPNDHLVPDHFDTAIVADQLRCGGILEAVRVARAGFTQHYPHADFIRRYRSLAWKEVLSGPSAKTSWSGAAPRTPVGPAIGHTRNFRNTKRHSTGSFQSPPPSFLPAAGTNNRGSRNFTNKTVPYKAKPPHEEITPAEAKILCQDLIKILYRKIQQQQEEVESNNATDRTHSTNDAKHHTVHPAVTAVGRSAASSPKSYSAPTWSLKSPSTSKSITGLVSPSSNAPSTKVKSFKVPSIEVPSPTSRLPPIGGFPKEKFTPWDENSVKKSIATSNVQQPAWKKRVSAISSSDYGKVGIQLGKTKVFLRHKAFEALERIRSTEQNKAATKLNALFRRYMARMAYIPYRDAFRQELRERRRMFEHANEHKESKEEEWEDGNLAKFRSRGHVSLDGQVISSVGTALPIFAFNCNYQSESLVDKWFESQIRDAIRNPVPRHQWGKVAPSDEQNFKWVISEDGLWVKNYSSFNAEANPSD